MDNIPFKCPNGDFSCPHVRTDGVLNEASCKSCDYEYYNQKNIQRFKYLNDLKEFFSLEGSLIKARFLILCGFVVLIFFTLAGLYIGLNNQNHDDCNYLQMLLGSLIFAAGYVICILLVMKSSKINKNGKKS